MTRSQPKTFIESLQGLRGFAALLVALFHIAALQDMIGIREGKGIWGVGWVGVDIFFVLSGFVMVWITSEKKHQNHAEQFLARRLFRIYPLWWAVSLILFAFYSIVHGSPASKDIVDPDQAWSYIIKSFFLIPQTLAPQPNVGWTLVFELFFYFLFSIILFFRLRENLIWCVAIWAIFVGVGIAQDWSAGGALNRLVFSGYNFEFMAGMMAALAAQKLSPYLQRFALPISIISFVIVISICVMINPEPFWRPLMLSIPLAVGLMGLVIWERTNAIVIPQAVKTLGDMSYSLYLTHPLSLIGWQGIGLFYPKGLFGSWAHSIPPSAILALDLVGALIVILLVTYIFYRLIERPVLMWSQRHLNSQRRAPL